MTQTQHTPGPWTYERNPNTAYTFNVFADGIRIAEVLSGPTKTHKDYFGGTQVDLENLTDGHDNAALIAAAPDLLEALTECLKLMRLKGVDYHDVNNRLVEYPCVINAKAAIAKATVQS